MIDQSLEEGLSDILTRQLTTTKDLARALEFLIRRGKLPCVSN